ncbi:MAG: glycosyltransferase [Candidatus Sumerlaeota bacterium]
MRVLQVLPTLSAGGAEGFVTNLGVSLKALGCDVRFFLLAGARGERGAVLLKRLQDAEIQVIGTEERSIRSPKTLFQLSKQMRNWRPDIVQANLYSASFVCALSRLLHAAPSAAFCRRIANRNFLGYRSPRVMRFLDRFFECTIACGPAVEPAYRDFMGESLHSRLVMIPNGGHLRSQIPSAEEKATAKKNLGIKPETFLVAHIGRIVGETREARDLSGGQKAQDVLLKSFAQAFVGQENKALVLLGDGPLREEAERLAQSLGIGDQTHFLGQQPEPWPLLEAADMFCFPSRHEGLPNVLPEAASCGLPIVASDIPEIRSITPDDAWLLQPVDDVEGFSRGMQQVAADIETLRRRASAVADDIRERFSMEQCARKYLEAYERALESRRQT